MATIVFRGDAPKVAQVTTLTPGGTIEASDLFIVTLNGKSVSVAAGGATVALTCDALYAALSVSVIPEFFEITWADSTTHITATGKTPGKPFTLSVSTTESNGDPADAQTFIAATTTANSGPNDAAVAANYSGGVLPANSDTLVFENSDIDLLWNLDALAAVTLTLLTIKQNYTGRIGLPKINTDNSAYQYYEYRPDYLEVGATTVNIGSGPGGGSPRIKLDVGSVATTCTVLNTGTAAENGLGAFIFKGTSSSNVLEILKGSVSVAVFAGETADLTGGCRIGYVDNQTADANVVLGSGVTLVAINKSGGRLQSESAITTLNMTAGSGDVTHLAGAITTANMDGGNLFYRSSATLATCNIGGRASLDFRQDPTPRTVSNLNIKSAGCEIHDENETVTWSAIAALPAGVGLEDITLRVGKGKTIAIS